MKPLNLHKSRFIFFGLSAFISFNAGAENLCDPVLHSAGLTQSSTDSHKSEEPRWKLVWSDEFDADGKIDPIKWTNEVQGLAINAEKQYYTDREHPASRIKNGLLVIEAREEKYLGKNYTSARLNSTASWTYGRFEVRAKVPSGNGTWPAIWMLPRKINYGERLWLDNGEIDIMETTGRKPGLVGQALFSDADNVWRGRRKYGEFTVATAELDFHTYAIEWLPGRIEFFIDGFKTFSERKLPGETWREWPFDQDFYLIINLAIGGTLGGPVDPAALPAKLEVDYIRVYQPTRLEDCHELP
jgi:beta-glucanase (GH16 family)